MSDEKKSPPVGASFAGRTLLRAKRPMQLPSPPAAPAAAAASSGGASASANKPDLDAQAAAFMHSVLRSTPASIATVNSEVMCTYGVEVAEFVRQILVVFTELGGRIPETAATDVVAGRFSNIVRRIMTAARKKERERNQATVSGPAALVNGFLGGAGGGGGSSDDMLYDAAPEPALPPLTLGESAVASASRAPGGGGGGGGSSSLVGYTYRPPIAGGAAAVPTPVPIRPDLPYARSDEEEARDLEAAVRASVAAVAASVPELAYLEGPR